METQGCGPAAGGSLTLFSASSDVTQLRDETADEPRVCSVSALETSGPLHRRCMATCIRH